MFNKGDIIKFNYEHDGLIEKDHLFIIADSHDSDYLFQLICIKGYHSGTIECYIKAESNNKIAISKEHFINELNRNFIKIHWDSFEDNIVIK